MSRKPGSSKAEFSDGIVARNDPRGGFAGTKSQPKRLLAYMREAGSRDASRRLASRSLVPLPLSLQHPRRNSA